MQNNAVDDSTQADAAQYADLGLMDAPTPVDNAAEPSTLPEAEDNSTKEVADNVEAKAPRGEDVQATPIPAPESKEEAKGSEPEKSDFEKMKEMYNEYRSFTDNNIRKYVERIKTLETQLKERPLPENTEAFKKLQEEKETYYTDAKAMSVIIRNLKSYIKDEFGEEVDEGKFYTPEPDYLKRGDMKTFRDELKQEVMKELNPQAVKEEDFDPVKSAVLDFMNRKNLIGINGKANDEGKKFVDMLKTTKLPESVGAELFETLTNIHKTLTPTPSKTNEGKEALAKVLSTVVTQSPQAAGDTYSDMEFGSLLKQKADWGI